MRAIANESKDGPRLFTVEPVDGVWKQLLSKKYRLQLWCEAEGCQHPVTERGKGVYEFDAPREWVKQAAPYANFIAGVLKTVVPLVVPAVNLQFGAGTIDELKIKTHLELIKEATGTLMEDAVEFQDPKRLREGMLTEGEQSGVRALHAKLRELDPNYERLGLTCMPTNTGDYLWLCKTHYEQLQSKIPDRIE